MPAPCYVNAHCDEVCGVCSQPVLLMYVYSRLPLFAIKNLQLMLLTVFLMKFKNCLTAAFLVPCFLLYRRTFLTFCMPLERRTGGVVEGIQN